MNHAKRSVMMGLLTREKWVLTSLLLDASDMGLLPHVSEIVTLADSDLRQIERHREEASGTNGDGDGDGGGAVRDHRCIHGVLGKGGLCQVDVMRRLRASSYREAC
jgi:hypothetical protein